MTGVKLVCIEGKPFAVWRPGCELVLRVEINKLLILVCLKRVDPYRIAVLVPGNPIVAKRLPVGRPYRALRSVFRDLSRRNAAERSNKQFIVSRTIELRICEELAIARPGRENVAKFARCKL